MMKSRFRVYTFVLFGLPWHFLSIIIFWGISQRTQNHITEKHSLYTSCSRKQVLNVSPSLVTLGKHFPIPKG